MTSIGTLLFQVSYCQTPEFIALTPSLSVFLRLLEYYAGILFLTSNRVSSFDLAFKSRIHIALHYPELTIEVRRQLWRNFLNRVPAQNRQLEMEADLDILEKEEINGRQIKNACKTAAALARKRGEKLQISHFNTVLTSIREFEKDFSSGLNEPAAVESGAT